MFLFNSCQKNLIRKEIKTGEVDSSLYFKQVEISDPFLAKLEENPNQSFTLSKAILPPKSPQPEKAKFKTIEGFRVQIFAGVDSLNALASKNLAKSTVKDTLYVFNEKGLLKLQVGDYPYYPQADSIKRIFRQTHFPGAWIVKTNILIPITDSVTDSTIQSKEELTATGKFKIQIMATADENKAQNIVNALKMQFNMFMLNVFYGRVFKKLICDD